MSIAPIIPTIRREPFDDPQWTFELKFDGFRAIADTVNSGILSNRGNRMHRFEALLGALPADCLLDGEIAALGEHGRSRPWLVALAVLLDHCWRNIRSGSTMAPRLRAGWVQRARRRRSNAFCRMTVGRVCSANS